MNMAESSWMFLQEAKIDPFHLADVQDVASSSVLRTGVQTLAALGGGDLVLFQAPGREVVRLVREKRSAIRIQGESEDWTKVVLPVKFCPEPAYILWMNKWSQSCSCFLVTCAQPFIHVPWGSNSRRGNPQPLWLTGSSWWEGWGSAWSHRIEANPFWFAEDSIYRWHQCLWFSCFGSLATFTILAACEKDLERLGGGEGEILPVWSDSHW